MSFPVPVPSTSDRSTVTSSSQQMSPTMAAGQFWVFEASVACYINQGANPTAAAADGNVYLGPNEPIIIDGSVGAKLAVIRAGADDGECTIVRAKMVA